MNYFFLRWEKKNIGFYDMKSVIMIIRIYLRYRDRYKLLSETEIKLFDDIR
jgi:hypothetical protein